MKPLEDVRIVAVEQYGAGPFGTMHLADLGADVVKLEDPRTGGDVSRYVPPYQQGEDSLFFQTFNRNKRSLSLDLLSDAGRTVFHDLVRVSDAVYSNLRGDIPERLGIRYADLCQINPKIVCCCLSGFGMTGPRRAEPAYDYMLQGIAGWMSLTGEPDGPPEKTGLSLVDFTGGYVAALATVIGIHAARRDGRGMDCDVSLFEVAMAMLTYPATWHLTAGYTPARTRQSAHPSLVPFQNFETADGWIVVGCAKEKFWRRLCTVLARPELAEDPRFVDFSARGGHRDELLPIIAREFTTRTTDEWIEVLSEGGVPCAPVNTVEEALLDPQVMARGLIITSEHDDFGTVRQVASPLNVGDSAHEHRRAPRRHEDAVHILTELLGYDAGDVRRLSEQGAFG
ncbi:MAG: CoA transferase [Euzebyales bacterium]|nr:CoA transferase [Euzebyales bacterium]MBA3621703.1 CoA transferase [Euzebyales bacterium]